MLPNCLLALASLRAEIIKVMSDLCSAEAEKLVVIFPYHRPFTFIFFLHICFFLAQENMLLSIVPFVLVHIHMCFPCRYGAHTFRNF